MNFISSGRIKGSPYKISIVANELRGLKVRDALNQLKYCRKGVSMGLYKLVYSAASNAEHNFNEFDIMDLKIIDIRIGHSLRLKRLDMRARGRANFIYKLYSIITVVLSR